MTARPPSGAASLLALLALIALACVRPAAAAAAQPAGALVVRRGATDSVVLTAAQLAALPREEVRANERGRAVTFAGATLQHALRAAGVSLDSLRGPALADVLLADRRDGGPLGAAEGPLRLVIPTDGRPARWVRQVRALAVVRVPPITARP